MLAGCTLPGMPSSRTQLENMLHELDDAVPRLAQEKPAAADFWAAFTNQAEAIRQSAEPADQAWVCDRLDAIQVKHQLVPPADQI